MRDSPINPSPRIPGPAIGRSLAVLALGLWLAIVVTTVVHHEFWRDEVRPWSLAGEARSPLDLYRLIQYDGHPFLWYLLLHLARQFTDSSAVLPVLSITIAFVAVVLFIARSPFPLWFRILFLFTGLPLYEYSVMARNYGIAMLLLFVAAACYPAREKHPVPLAATLALLANTNAYAAGLTGLIGLVWLIEGPGVWTARSLALRLRTRLPILAIPLLGCAVSFLYARPHASTILTATYAHLDPMDVWRTVVASVSSPQYVLDAILPNDTPTWLSSLVVYGCILGLWRRPALLLAAIVALLFFGFMQLMVFPGAYRHQGLLVVFFLFLYWVTLEGDDASPARSATSPLFRLALYGGLGLILVRNVPIGLEKVRTDLTHQMSTGAALGAFLTHSARYRDAILVAEPDYLVESLPYYASNSLYLPRERRFGKTVSWTTDSAPALSLSELLAAARQLERSHRQPVLIVLGHSFPITATPSTTAPIAYSYNKTFAFTPAAIREFRDHTIRLADFTHPMADENFTLFALRESAHDIPLSGDPRNRDRN